MFNLI